MPWRPELPVKCLYVTLLHLLSHILHFLSMIHHLILSFSPIFIIFVQIMIGVVFFFPAPLYFPAFSSLQNGDNQAEDRRRLWIISDVHMNIQINTQMTLYKFQIPNPKINIVSKDQIPRQPHCLPKSPDLVSLSYDS